ncbi:MAG: glycerate kinase, partial [Bacteroidaceae bacterium]|nr:glycerate kinase [Bacteroidaceae bacterium]
MTIIIALDSLKGCLSAPDACRAVAEGIQSVRPDANIVLLPMSDGGEGLTDVLSHVIPGRFIDVQVHGPLAEKMHARYLLSSDCRTAYMEMASACGLTLVSEALRNPLHTTTYGLGEMMTDALTRGAKHLMIGIGGSATSDAGLGMLQALGYTFYNQQQLLTAPLTGECLEKVTAIHSTNLRFSFEDITLTVACDVQNPLYGPNGAAFVFAPQKGADAQTVKRLDEGLQHFARISAGFLGKDCAQLPGAGAAGGLGFALTAFLNAKLKSGIELVLDTLQFDKQLEGADWVITGEGKSDPQTLMGKVPAGILRRAQVHRVPVVLV